MKITVEYKGNKLSLKRKVKNVEDGLAMALILLEYFGLETEEPDLPIITKTDGTIN